MRILLASLGLLLLAALVWFLQDAARADTQAGGGTDSTQSQAPDRAEAALAAPADRRQGADATRQEVQRQVAARQRHPDDVEVRCVRATDGSPVAGAWVAFRRAAATPSWQDLPEADQRALAAQDLDAYRRLGEVLRTDAEGRCWVRPDPGAGLYLFALHEDLYGAAGFGPKHEGPLEIKLRVDRRLDLVVKTAGGDPAAGVLIFTRGSGPKPRRIQHGATDAEGCLVMRHVQDRFAATEASRFVIWAEGHGLRTPEREVDLLAAPQQRVELHLPPGGSITFALQDAAGRPYPQAGLGEIHLVLAMFEREPGRNESINRLRQAGLFDRSGRARVEHVAFGMIYAARAHALFARPQIGKGPTRAQPDLEVPLRVDAGLISLAGRVVDAAGEPLAEEQLRIELRHDRGSHSAVAQPDAEGRFRAPFPGMEEGTVVDLKLRIYRPSAPDLVHRRIGFGPLRAGVHDLGDCRLEVPPVLLSGALVLGEGLSIQHPPYLQIQEKERRRWQTRHDLAVVWSEGHRFTFHGGTKDGSELRLVVPPGAWKVVAPIPFAAGRKDLQVPLSGAGKLQVRFLVDDPSSAERCTLRLEGRRPSPELSFAQRMQQSMRDRYRLRADGDAALKAVWEGLEPDTYRLRLELQGAAQPLVDIPDIVVRAGDNQDPRLRDIDLRGRIRKISVQVLDDQGKPLQDEDARVIVADAEGQNWYGLKLHAGRCELPISGPTQLRVLASGYRLAEVKGVQGDRQIQLEAAPRIRVRVRWPFALPAGVTPSLQLAPILEDAERRIRFHPNSSRSGGLGNYLKRVTELDAEGRGVLQPAVPGTYRVYLALDPRGRGRYSDCLEPGRLELGDADAEELVIEVKAAQLRKDLDRK